MRANVLPASPGHVNAVAITIAAVPNSIINSEGLVALAEGSSMMFLLPYMQTGEPEPAIYSLRQSISPADPGDLLQRLFGELAGKLANSSLRSYVTTKARC